MRGKLSVRTKPGSPGGNSVSVRNRAHQEETGCPYETGLKECTDYADKLTSRSPPTH